MRWPSRWRILRDGPGAAAWNMALDEALAREAEPDRGVLRTYAWSRASLSFGRNQAVRRRYDPQACEALGVEAVRRPTGGREVLHDRELTYSLIVPLGEARPGAARELYAEVNAGLVTALRSLGVDARSADPEGRTPGPDAGACFRTPARGEVEVGGAKVVGSAQVRLGGALLQHGSVLLGPPSVELGSLLTASADRNLEPEPGPEPDESQGGIGLVELLGRPVAFSALRGAVEAGLAGELGGRWELSESRPDEVAAARRLCGRYDSTEWNWRR
jgi:lipoyl(octanoyl) transferase